MSSRAGNAAPASSPSWLVRIFRPFQSTSRCSQRPGLRLGRARAEGLLSPPGAVCGQLLRLRRGSAEGERAPFGGLVSTPVSFMFFCSTIWPPRPIAPPVLRCSWPVRRCRCRTCWSSEVFLAQRRRSSSSAQPSCWRHARVSDIRGDLRMIRESPILTDGKERIMGLIMPSAPFA